MSFVYITNNEQACLALYHVLSNNTMKKVVPGEFLMCNNGKEEVVFWLPHDFVFLSPVIKDHESMPLIPEDYLIDVNETYKHTYETFVSLAKEAKGVYYCGEIYDDCYSQLVMLAEKASLVCDVSLLQLTYLNEERISGIRPEDTVTIDLFNEFVKIKSKWVINENINKALSSKYDKKIKINIDHMYALHLAAKQFFYNKSNIQLTANSETLELVSEPLEEKNLEFLNKKDTLKITKINIQEIEELPPPLPYLAQIFHYSLKLFNCSAETTQKAVFSLYYKGVISNPAISTLSEEDVKNLIPQLSKVEDFKPLLKDASIKNLVKREGVIPFYYDNEKQPDVDSLDTSLQNTLWLILVLSIISLSSPCVYLKKSIKAENANGHTFTGETIYMKNIGWKNAHALLLSTPLKKTLNKDDFDNISVGENIEVTYLKRVTKNVSEAALFKNLKERNGSSALSNKTIKDLFELNLIYVDEWDECIELTPKGFAYLYIYPQGLIESDFYKDLYNNTAYKKTVNTVRSVVNKELSTAPEFVFKNDGNIFDCPFCSKTGVVENRLGATVFCCSQNCGFELRKNYPLFVMNTLSNSDILKLIKDGEFPGARGVIKISKEEGSYDKYKTLITVD